MENNLVGTIRLSGDDSINFINTLYRPQHNEVLDEINSTVTIKRTDEGFEANIIDLDLSFLGA
jgi:hypothetical protein